MEDTSMLLNVGTVLVAALIGGTLARVLRLPVLVGFLLAGVAVGPHTPGFTAEEATVGSVAGFGVVLLMFAVGVQFSLKELAAVRKTALLGGGIQIFGTIGLGVLLGIAFGWGGFGGLFLGCALSLSSTAVVMRILEERGELGSAHGAIILGICVVQDLSLVLMVSLLPALAVIDSQGIGAMSDVLIAIARAAVFIGATLLLALFAIPKILAWVARGRSHELFLISVVVLALGMALAAEEAGLGPALGAFLAGVVVSESPYSSEIFSQVRPLRDVFSSIFFVSVGMLLDPVFLWQNAGVVGLVVLAILLGKTAIAYFGIQLCGWHARTSMLAAFGLAQMGEFSFVLATEGASRKIIAGEIASIVLSAALITILLTPFLFRTGSGVYGLLARSPWLAQRFHRRSLRSDLAHDHLKNQYDVIILGSGRVGRYVSDALRAHGVSHIVVDYDAQAIARLRQHGVPLVYGDASSPIVLAKASPARAKLAVVALPEAAVTELAVKALHELAPELTIVARVRRGDDIPRMRLAGANTVVHGEFESGVETIRQSLESLGLGYEEVESYIDTVRQHRYRQAT